MKKGVILCGFAAAAVIAFASSEKLNFIKNNKVVKSVRVEKIDHIGYSSENSVFKTLDVVGTDGKTESVNLDDFDHVEYVAPLPENPISVTVEPHHKCATLHFTSSDPNAWYRVEGCLTSELKDIDESEWADYLVAQDIEFIRNTAEGSGRPLSYFKNSDIFHKGELTRDWFPSVVIQDNTPITLVVYTGKIAGDDIEVTSEPKIINFTTKKIEDLGVKFNLTADLTSNSITVKADAEGGSDIPFYIELYRVEDVAANGLEALVRNTLYTLEIMVYKYGQSWSEVTFKTHGERTWTNRCMGEQYIAVAFGCEYGVATTDASRETFTIPAAEVTDPCTFTVAATQLSPAEFSLQVQPSSDNTRWAAFFVDSEDLKVSPEQYIANKIYNINYMNTFQWDNTDYIHTGAATINSHNDAIGGEYMKLGNEYQILICGIDETGTRTTAVKSVTCIPEKKEQKSLTFEVTFSDFDGKSQWTHYLTANVTPSDKEAKYVFLQLPADNSYANLDYSDEEFIQRYVEVQGQYLELKTGDMNKKLSFASSYSSADGGYVFKPYIVAVFGYDGAPTSGLYVYSIDPATGSATLVRSPKAEQALAFEVTPGEFDGSSKWYHFLTLNIKPSDKEAKYVIGSYPETNAYVKLDCTDEEFIQRYVEAQGKYLELQSGDLSKKFTYSENFTTGAFDPYIFFVFGYDGSPTSPLYAFKVDTATGTLTQLHGPGMPVE